MRTVWIIQAIPVTQNNSVRTTNLLWLQLLWPPDKNHRTRGFLLVDGLDTHLKQSSSLQLSTVDDSIAKENRTGERKIREKRCQTLTRWCKIRAINGINKRLQSRKTRQTQATQKRAKEKRKWRTTHPKTGFSLSFSSIYLVISCKFRLFSSEQRLAERGGWGRGRGKRRTEKAQTFDWSKRKREKRIHKKENVLFGKCWRTTTPTTVTHSCGTSSLVLLVISLLPVFSIFCDRYWTALLRKGGRNGWESGGIPDGYR